MELEFYKIHTCCNDFIVLNHLYKTAPFAAEDLPRLAHAICNRHVGVGGNGLVTLASGEDRSVSIRCYLPAGEESTRIGDALLCAARLAFDSGVAGGEKLTAVWPGGRGTVDVIDSTHFRIALGSPRIRAEGTELREAPDREYAITVVIDGKRESVTPLHLGYEAVVHFSTSLVRPRIMRLSRALRRNSTPEAHPVFVQVYSRDELQIRTWFRNEPIDYSSAAGVAVVAATINGFTERDAIVHCNGEELFVEWSSGTNEVYATAATDYVFTGTYYYDERIAEISEDADGPRDDVAGQ